MLWKFQFLVESKKLEKVMWLLEGNVLELEAPRPVVNAKVVKGQVKAKGQDRFALIRELVLERKSVTPADMRAIMVTVGLSPTGYPFYQAKCREAGLLSAKRPDGTYRVIKGQPKATARRKTKRGRKPKASIAPHIAGGNGTKATTE